MPLLNTISTLYRTLEAPETWDSALAGLADALDADHVVLDLRSASPVPYALLATRIPDDYLEQLAAHPEYERLYATVLGTGSGHAIHSAQVIDRQMRSRSALFNDVIRPMGGHHAIFGLIPVSAGQEHPALISACRAASRADFPMRPVQYLDSLLPHLASVLRLHQRLVPGLPTGQPGVCTGEWWHEPVLDQLPLGVLLLDANARPYYANRLAERLINAHPTLSMDSHGGLSAADPVIQRTLRLSIAAALSADGNERSTVLRLAGSGPAMDLWVRIVPLARDGAASQSWQRASVAIFLDGNDEAALDPATLSSLFGLTSRESALAQQLLAGADLAAAAAALNVSLETVRSRLKILFAKTGTHRQAELLRLLTRLGRQGKH